MPHNVALIGAGVFAHLAHLPAIVNCKDLSLIAIHSRSEQSSTSLSDKAKSLGVNAIDSYHGDDGLRTMLERQDIQTIVTCLPIPIQPDIIRAAWAAGKNVISEKPVARDVDAANALIKLYETDYKPKGIQWIIAEQFPYELAFVKAYELCKSGELGELHSFQLDWNFYMAKDNPFYKTAWRQKPDYQGGYLLDGGVHQMACLRYLLEAFGLQLQAVCASAWLIREDLEPFDTLQALFKTSDPKVGGMYMSSLGHEVSKGPSLLLNGSKAQLEITRGQHGYSLSIRRGRQDTDLGTYGATGVDEEFIAFAEALIGGIDSSAAKIVAQKSGPRAALADVKCIEESLNSAQSQEWRDLAV